MTPQGIHQVHVHVKKGEKAQGRKVVDAGPTLLLCLH